MDYLYAVYERKNGTANSYIMAMHIIDELFRHNDVFALNGKSITSVDDISLLKRIAEFVCSEQKKYQKGSLSFFDNINIHQSSYPGKGFCSAAIKQLLQYYSYDLKENEAWNIMHAKASGRIVSKELATLFKLDKEGRDVIVETRTRLGQGYFRKMILKIYDNRCCVTGLNVPQTLRASHIVEWAKDKANRMNPENGLCLCATYDAAFDKHLISFDDDYRMIVSRVVKDYYTNDVTRDYFEKFEGKQLSLPLQYLPNKKLLERHRNLMVG